MTASLRVARLAATALLTMAAVSSAADVVGQPRAIRYAFGVDGSLSPRGTGYPRKSGWTDARYRRAAAKKRNQARHRAACRGSK